MIVQLEPSDIIRILTDHMRNTYGTPNVSILDKSLKKLSKVNVSINVVPVSARNTEMVDAGHAERMRNLTGRMNEEEVTTVNVSFEDSGL